jgi:hypothetical protein
MRMPSEADFGCKLGAKCTQFCLFLGAKTPITLLECAAGTTGLEPADLCRDSSALRFFNDL